MQALESRQGRDCRILAAVEYWSHADLGALNKEWKSRVERIAKLVQTVPGVATSIEIPEGGNSYLL